MQKLCNFVSYKRTLTAKLHVFYLNSKKIFLRSKFYENQKKLLTETNIINHKYIHKSKLKSEKFIKVECKQI